MSKVSNYLLAGLLLLCALASDIQLNAQTSGREFRRSAIHNGNLVKTGFGNWGVIGQPTNKPRGAWIFQNNGYIGDVSPMVGAEVFTNGDIFHSVVITPVSRPTQNQEESTAGQFWGFEPDGRYFNPAQQEVALSTNSNSWPSAWPDKLSDPEDPGWPGAWNGFFGKDVFNADQESYFVMDDDRDEEFNFGENNSLGISFKPDANNSSRNGLGLAVKVRGLQWAQFLAQDTIFWLYEIFNSGTTDYSRTVFGMLVGTYVGVTFTSSSGSEFDDDYSFFDVELDMTFTADFDDNVSRNPQWVGSDVGAVAYAFLESPGNPFDGIDNDGDAEDSIIPTGRLFTEEDFQPRIINAGDQVVIVNDDFSRELVTVPANDTVFVTRASGAGENMIAISPGTTQLVEGDLVLINGQETVNPNAVDGIDNDLDGLVDENFQLHYRQIRREVDGTILIDILAPVKHVDYFTGDGANNPMIDEKRNDLVDNDNDWNPEFDDLGADGQPSTFDFGENDGMPTSGEPTDVDESDQIGLTSFEYFVPSQAVDLANDEQLWNRMEPGLFDVPLSIQNNKPTNGEDGDFIYGSGHFPLLNKQIERFSLALVYGDGGGRNVEIDDLLKNRETVQKIFDADYRFPQPPLKPTLTTVAGDGKVTLYWDRRAEESIDPVLRERDFEGYKIYKATDPGLIEAFVVTDALGSVTSFKPIEQFDLDNNVQGFFRGSREITEDARGLSFFLGENTGLQHTFVDDDVDNGRRYFYALVAYDRGDEFSDIFPSENTKFITTLSTGEILTDINTAVVTPNGPVAGFQPPEKSTEVEAVTSVGTGRVFSEVVDETVQTGHDYEVGFRDTGTDAFDNDDDWDIITDDVGTDGIPDTNDPDGTEANGVPDPGEPNLDFRDNEEYIVRVTSSYSTRDLSGDTETFVAKDTFFVNLTNSNLIEETVQVRNSNGGVVPPENYVIDATNGKIRGAQPGSLGEDQYEISYQYYPVFESPNLQGSPFADETKDSDIFDGVQLVFDNVAKRSSILMDAANSGFNSATPLQVVATSDFIVIVDPISGRKETLLPRPADYEIHFFDSIVDTSQPPPLPIPIPGTPVNFQVWNVTEQEKVKFLFTDTDRDSMISPLDKLNVIEDGVEGATVLTWNFDFFVTDEDDSVGVFGAGDTCFVSILKPFRSGDLFGFQTEPAAINEQQARKDSTLDQIRVVPNPYIVATAFESPPAPGIRGRGERKIDFIRVPNDARVHIFTSRGEHIRTLEHSGSIHEGAISWDLKTKENLDVAYGIYFYVIESSVGVKRGKIGIIK